jgi:uncharacterized membrane protein YdjX (TVP38/TMEM64 family)
MTSPEHPAAKLAESEAGLVAARRRRGRYVLLGLVGVLLLAGVLAWRGDVGGLAREAVNGIRAAGPWAFFIGMAVLPALGFPVLPFVLTVGPSFAPALGIGVTVACGVAALTINALLTYLLAARALRPVMQRLLAWLGYRLPEPPQGSDWQIVFLVRLMPGLPFWLQGYLLGMMRLPLLPYMVGSVFVPGVYVVAATVGGAALMQGRGGVALWALAGAGILAAVLHLLRKRYGRSRSG